MSRPSDHYDSPSPAPESAREAGSASITQPKLGVVGWLRWFWRQLSSMRTALFLLLLLALAAVPGSLVPQRSSDPNGVTQYFVDNPTLAPILDSVQMFGVYSSVWFSSIYLLLFISLVGCVIPRTKHHFDALRSAPPKTPARLNRLGGFITREYSFAEPVEAGPSTSSGNDVTGERPSTGSGNGGNGGSAAILESARVILKKAGYRVRTYQDARSTSVSAERGYARETGNLVFHTALVGILITVGIGGGFGYAGQRVVVEGQTFVNTLLAFDSFNPGRFFSDDTLTPFTLRLDEFDATYETQNLDAFGQPTDYTAHVTTTEDGDESDGEVKVNSPLKIGGSDVYLLGNGYAPTLTVKNAEGTVVFTDSVPFLPQDANLTSLGVVKITDGLPEQVGMIGFFYPTQDVSSTGAYFSSFPEAEYPVVTLNVYTGDLGLNEGVPTSVYSLATDKMTQLTGGKTGVDSIELKPGETAQLPNGMGSVTLDGIKRFASFDIHRDPTQLWVLVFAILVLGGLLTSLFIPRRRVWVKLIENADGTGVTLEYAGLARGDDPRLDDAVAELADKHIASLPSARAATTSPEITGAKTPDDA
ncbi:cytochrome C biogenesis protein [Agreia sp. Leaf244]|uniref:cytochrome c biogenesis protein ResB n=1 Tax=Agreia sp. Leaf244 TaxID=1736305 RepID=UPI0006F2DDF6|nr:cytochrome c biogenesis protein ResB [Agreia sp. Leaf244]KQO11523.1 cytochrome C biogenesis protein [Agreia sp. Leaf244]